MQYLSIAEYLVLATCFTTCKQTDETETNKQLLCPQQQNDDLNQASNKQQITSQDSSQKDSSPSVQSKQFAEQDQEKINDKQGNDLVHQVYFQESTSDLSNGMGPCQEILFNTDGEQSFSPDGKRMDLLDLSFGDSNISDLSSNDAFVHSVLQGDYLSSQDQVDTSGNQGFSPSEIYLKQIVNSSGGYGMNMDRSNMYPDNDEALQFLLQPQGDYTSWYDDLIVMDNTDDHMQIIDQLMVQDSTDLNLCPSIETDSNNLNFGVINC